MKKIDGQDVANASRPIRLEVTKGDIENGAPLNPNACAIARACVRQVKGATAAKVHLSCVYIMVKGQWFRWRMPEYATREVVAFDRGGRFVPGEYDLLAVPTSDLVRRVKKVRGAVPAASRKRKPPRTRHYTQDVRAPAYQNEPPAK